MQIKYLKTAILFIAISYATLYSRDNYSIFFDAAVGLTNAGLDLHYGVTVTKKQLLLSADLAKIARYNMLSTSQLDTVIKDINIMAGAIFYKNALSFSAMTGLSYFYYLIERPNPSWVQSQSQGKYVITDSHYGLPLRVRITYAFFKYVGIESNCFININSCKTIVGINVGIIAGIL